MSLFFAQLVLVFAVGLGPSPAFGDSADCLTRIVPVQDPDSRPSDPFQLIPAGANAIAEVLEHGGKSTTSLRNSGFVSYMQDSVYGGDRFFGQARAFLEELRKADLDSATPQGPDSAPHPIDSRPTIDVYALALRHAGNNPYWALKLLTLYGHDDFANELASGDARGCRGASLDALAPRGNSALYRPGALARQGYSREFVERGRKVAQACASGQLTLAERNLCNDRKPEYQADYYHVLASAFLGCRRTIAENAGTHLLPIATWAGDWVTRFYLDAVKQYKLRAFEEFIDRSVPPSSLARGATVAAYAPSSPNEISPALAEVLKSALRNLANDLHPSLPPLKSLRHPLDPRAYEAARAIVARYEFEVEFRLAQHREGSAFGRKACAELQTYDYLPFPEATCGAERGTQ